MSAKAKRKPRKVRRVVLGWQPIETAPKDGRSLWLVEDGTLLGLSVSHQFMGYWFGSESYVDGGCWRSTERFSVAYPTHWMPLPDPPKAKR